MVDRLAELREILLGEEQQKIETLEERLENSRISPEELAELLPEAFLKKSSDQHLITALQKPVSESVRASITRDTDAFAELLFPVMSPAIRRSIVETVRSMMQNISQVIDQSFSLRGISWRLESLRTNVPFHEIVLRNTLLYRVEQVFLIHNDSGLLIRHLSADETVKQDPDAVSAMLTAIQDFTTDSFFTGENDEEHLAKIDTESHTIWITQGPDAHMACVISGIPPSDLKSHFRDVLSDIHQEFSDKLEEYSGNKDDLVLADDLLRTCLLSEQKEPEKKRGLSSVVLPLILLAVVAALCWYGYSKYDQRSRFKELGEKLSSLPGVTLLDADIRGDTFHFSGLRDPLSPEPETVIRNNHHDDEEITTTWQPYLSLEEDLVFQRATRTLQPPDSVKLEFRDSVIHADGVASAEWRQQCLSIVSALPGVNGCNVDELQDLDTVLLEKVTGTLDPPETVAMSVTDTSLRISGTAPMLWITAVPSRLKEMESLAAIDTQELTPIEADELEQLAASIEMMHLYFDSNSAEVQASETLDNLLKSVTRLVELSRLLDTEVRLIMTGRANGDPDNPANIELSQRRAETLYSLLLNEYGIPESAMVIDQNRPAAPEHASLSARRLDLVVLTAKKESTD